MARHERGLAVSLRLPARATFLAKTLGDPATVAAMLEVDAEQLSRWINGEEVPELSRARQILDLDHVVAVACLVWQPEMVRSWLVAANTHLEGSRPIDVMTTRGSEDVLEALDAEGQFVFG